MASYYDDLQFTPRDPDWSQAYRPPKTGSEKWHFLDDAFRESLSPFAVERIYERRSSQFEGGEPFKVDDEVRAELQRDYSPEDEKYLTESGTQEEFLARKRYIQEDRDRLASIGEAGASGIAATLAFSLIDPVSIGLGVATGGLGIGAKSAGTARALKIAAMSGIENAAIESLFMQGNTQSSYKDLLAAFAVGGIIGGSLSPLTRKLHPEVGRDADAVDAAIRIDSDAEVANEILQQVRDTAPRSEVDMRAVRSAMDLHEQRLNTEVGTPMTKTQAKQLQKEIDDLVRVSEMDQVDIAAAQESIVRGKADIEAKRIEFQSKLDQDVQTIHAKYEAKIRAMQSEASPTSRFSKYGKVVQEDLDRAKSELKALEDARSKEIRAAEKSMERRIAAAEKKLKIKTDELALVHTRKRVDIEAQIKDKRDQLEAGLRHRDSKVALERWGKMSDEEKIKELFQDSPPLRRAELERQAEGSTQATEQAKAEAKSSDLEEPSLTRETTEHAVGAMRAGERPIHKQYDVPEAYQAAWERMAEDGANIPEDLRGLQYLGRSEFSKRLYSASTALMNSGDYGIRGFAWHLFDSPQGGSQNPYTVASRVRNWQNVIRSAKKNRLTEGMEEWAKEIGIPAWKVFVNPKYFMDFHKKVIREIKRPIGSDPVYASPAIQKAAEGVKAQLRKAGEIRKNAGEAGFENLDLDKNYFPIILNEGVIKSAIPTHGKAKIRDLISLSYQQGHYKLDKDVSDAIADSYIQRVLNHGLTMRDYVSTRVPSSDMNAIAQKLKKAGVDDDIINDLLDTSMEKEIKQHLSDRAKKSLYPDINAELNGLKMIDLIDSDVPKLLESYTRDAAGGAAFAKLGFKTKQQVMKFIEHLEKTSKNNGRDPITVRREIQTLKDGVELAYGRSLNEDAHTPFVQWLSRLRDVTSLLRLQFVGLASFPELGRITANRGLKIALSECKDLGAFRGTKAFREGGKYSGRFNRPDLDEIEEAMGYIGEDHALFDQGIRYDSFEDSEFGTRFGAAMDRMLAQGRRIQEITSAFRTIQGSCEKIAVRSLAHQIKKWAYSAEGSFKGLRESEIKRAGWFEDDFLGQLRTWMNDHPKTEMYKGREVQMFNFGEMPPEMQERLQIGMHRIIASDMQRPLLGETPMYMHKWLGQTLTQFRSFSILSLEKQLLHDIRHDKIAGSLIALHSIALSYMALGVQVMHNAIGRNDRDEYIESQMSGRNLSVGIFNRMGQLASAGIGLDMLATLGALPSELTAAPSHPGGRVLSGGAVPVVGTVGDSFAALRTAMDAAFGRDEDSGGNTRDKASAADVVRDLHKILPAAKTIGLHQGFNYLEESLRE